MRTQHLMGKGVFLLGKGRVLLKSRGFHGKMGDFRGLVKKSGFWWENEGIDGFIDEDRGFG